MSSGKRKPPDDEEILSFSQTGSQPGATAAQMAATAAGPGRGRRSGAATFEMGDAYYRSLYTTDPDFKQLAKQDAAFAASLKGNGQLDFSDPASVMQLTKTLLKLDFGLDIELPEDRLCPPVPNRHNYILWLKGLLDTSSYDESGGRLSGLDIGTGASCIYPLLGCAQRPWYFLGTDIDSKSFSHAQKNVALNGFQSRIKLLLRRPTDSLIPLDDLGVENIDFVMTNPPFYVSDDELVSSAAKKARPPHSACTGAAVEMVCDGGEVAFVGRILDESLVLRDRVRWYTSMLGKVSSLEVLVERLRAEGIDNFAVTEFVQGNKTRRWAVGWSFGAMRPTQEVSRGMKAVAWRKVLPLASEVELMTFTASGGVGALAERVRQAVSQLELISWEWDQERLQGIGRARENVWSRAWRRKKLREESGGEVSHIAGGDDDDGVCAFGFCIAIRVARNATSLSCRWLEGHDQAIFESFNGFLKGRIT